MQSHSDGEANFRNKTKSSDIKLFLLPTCDLRYRVDQTENQTSIRRHSPFGQQSLAWQSFLCLGLVSFPVLSQIKPQACNYTPPGTQRPRFLIKRLKSVLSLESEVSSTQHQSTMQRSTTKTTMIKRSLTFVSCLCRPAISDTESLRRKNKQAFRMRRDINFNDNDLLRCQCESIKILRLLTLSSCFCRPANVPRDNV